MPITTQAIDLPCADEEAFLRWALAQEGMAFLDSGPHGWSSLRWGPRATKAFSSLQRGELDQWLRANGPDLPADSKPHGPGAIVFAGYEATRFFEPQLPPFQSEGPNFPDLWAAAFDWALIRSPEGEWAFSGCEGASQPSLGTREKPELSPSQQAIEAHWNKARYADAFRETMRLIYEGVFYEANLTQAYSAKAEIDAIEAYLRLRASSSPSYGAYLDLGGGRRILSSSPECFLIRDGQSISTEPIKGTRPRSSDPAKDRALAEELAASEKEHAELTMVVDMQRHDLSRICQAGSVEVPFHATVVSLPHVHHMKSLVSGRLKADTSFEDILRATFAGGSITGAPKFSVISELSRIESERRGPYTGSIFALGGSEQMISNILIRTILVEPNSVRFNTGGGIVADSVLEAEYLECFQKAAGILEALSPQLDVQNLKSLLDSSA